MRPTGVPDPQRPCKEAQCLPPPPPVVRSSSPPRPWPSSRSPPAAATPPPSTAAKDNPYGLQQAGTLRVGTLTDAPPNVFLKDGKFTGFDNDLLTAVAGKLGLKVQFVGTDFSSLLAQVKNRKFDLGSSSITITEARKKTVDFTNGYDFGYFGLDVPDGLRHHVLRPAEGQARRGRAGHGPGRLRHRGRPEPGAGPRLQQRAEPAEVRHGRRPGSPPPRSARRPPRTAAARSRWRPSSSSSAPTAFAVAPGNTAFRTALNKALDQVIKDGTWTRLQEQYYPGRPVPKDFTARAVARSPFPPVKAAAGS